MSTDPDADIFGMEYRTNGGELFKIVGASRRHPALLESIKVKDDTPAFACRDIVRRYLVEKRD